MAERELTRIRVRRGRDEDLPILYQGEFGFSTDVGTLYIGSGNRNIRIVNMSELLDHTKIDEPHTYGEIFSWKYNEDTESLELIVTQPEGDDLKPLNINSQGEMTQYGNKIWDTSLLVVGAEPSNPKVNLVWVDVVDKEIKQWNGTDWDIIVEKMKMGTVLDGGTFG